MKALALTLRLGLLALCVAGLATAQQGTGTISGIVMDQQGAVIPGAQVEVRNTGTNALFATSSNESGLYVAPGLVVGEYEIAVESEGFRRSVRSGVTLQVGQNADVNVTLEIGQVTEIVEVVGEAPLVDTGGATIGEVIEAQAGLGPADQRPGRAGPDDAHGRRHLQRRAHQFRIRGTAAFSCPRSRSTAARTR